MKKAGTDAAGAGSGVVDSEDGAIYQASRIMDKIDERWPAESFARLRFN